MVNLPSKKSEVNLNFKNQKIGIIGQSGIGKSEFLAQEPKALFLETEAGLNFLEVYKIPIRCWDDIRDTYMKLKELEIDCKKNGKEFPYSMIVIDTIDRYVDFAEEEIISRGKEFYKSISDQINTIADLPNGAGWNKTRNLVMNSINKLEEFPCAVSYIGHLSSKTIGSGTNKYNKNTISLWAGVGNDMLAWCDHLLHVEARMVGDRLIRTVWTKPTQSKEAKSRGGVITDGMKWESDMKENYRVFRELFT